MNHDNHPTPHPPEISFDTVKSDMKQEIVTETKNRRKGIMIRLLLILLTFERETRAFLFRKRDSSQV